ncbi:hypothetical protein [Dactylosporangium cerinum]
MTTYLPGVSGTDPAAVHAAAVRQLADAGFGPDDIVHVTQYVTGAGGALDVHRVPVSVVPVAGFPDPAHTFGVELAVFAGGGTAIDTGDGECCGSPGTWSTCRACTPPPGSSATSTAGA